MLSSYNQNKNDKQNKITSHDECDHCCTSLYKNNIIEKDCCESYICNGCNDHYCYKCGAYSCPVCGCQKCG